MKERFIKKIGKTVIITFLLYFILIIFGPIELFFGNYRDLGVVYEEIGWNLWGIGIALTLLTSCMIVILPCKLRRISLAIVWAISIAAYIQGMFLNKGLESIGADADGYVPELGKIIGNGLVWITVLIVALVCIRIKKEGFEKFMLLTASVLIGMQLVGMISLFLTAEKDAFEYKESALILSGEEQYVVSDKENIIVIVLDNFANIWYDRAVVENPEIEKVLKDFTYYTNADSNYYKTYPSLLHIITGYPFSMGEKTNEFVFNAWNNVMTEQYFGVLKEHNYKVNVYTDASYILTAYNGLEVMQDKVDNVTYQNISRKVNDRLLNKVMIKMSFYRYAPDIIKPYFNVLNSEYTSLVSSENDIEYLNYEYYEQLEKNGLEVDDKSNYFIIQHLNGTHEFINDAECQYAENVTQNETINGIFYMLDEYFRQLQELKVYDKSTIIICADHGTLDLPQPIFFIKEKMEVQDKLKKTNAPIDYDAICPTILSIIGEDYEAYGKRIYDYKEGEIRERIYSIPRYDQNFPEVPRVDGKGNGATNVYYQYKYEGDLSSLINNIIDYNLYQIVQLKDSLY